MTMTDTSLGPKGLTIEQQKEIAEIQAKSVNERYKPRITTQTSLYIGELAPDIDEEKLKAHFDNVKHVQIYRDSISNENLGYARIDFYTPKDCSAAFENLNNSKIDGIDYRLMISDRDTSKRVSGTGNIIIKNLHPGVDNKSLYDTFSRWGNVTSCRVINKLTGGTVKGYGYVNYDTYAAAERAIALVNGKMLFGIEVHAAHQIPKHEREVTSTQNDNRFTNVYVKNLSMDVTEQDLNQLFSTMGSVSSILIQRDDQQKSKGFGFVNFELPEDAERAVNELHDTEFFGKKLFVTRAQKRSEREDDLKRHSSASRHTGVNLYIKNLADNVTDEMLVERFSAFGTITSAKIMREEKTGASKGFGFVCFSSSEEASKAVTEMNGQSICSKSIYVALAQRKEDRRHFLETQISQKSK
ncbi:RNA-binding domain-containing protein [Rhizopus microsporus]|uniref:RNA-binding domain-containing protein n=2 Tax=Rhizopus TaxID=4842 RepID=A0A1X0RY30_RHIZD|nr:RNA-binding domain-containing protein [Rhizopus microsporus]